MALPVGAQLGSGTISGPDGAGRMGKVYRANDPRLVRQALAEGDPFVCMHRQFSPTAILAEPRPDALIADELP